MNTLIEPNIHPILVHFAYALSVTSVICYLLASFQFAGRWRDSLRPAADWMLAFASLAIIATIAAGFQAYYTVGHDAPSHAAMTTHRNWAVPSGIAILLLAAWRWTARRKAPSGIFKTLLLAAAISLSITAWWGGHIVYNYGLGVKSLPAVTGDGHDHDHGGDEHKDAAMPAEHETQTEVPLPTKQTSKIHDNSDGHHAAEKAAILPQPLKGSAESIVNAFGAALKSGSADTLRALIADDVVIAEGGGAERSFEQYASHHMPSDMAFIGAVETTLKKRDIIEGPTLTTIVSQSQIHGTYKGKAINSQMMETMVLRKSDNGWRIAHIHWSSAPIKEEHGH